MSVAALWQVPLIVVAVAALAAVPLYADGYQLALGVGIMMYAVLATAWALFSGPTRYISLATVAFFGIGAYTMAVLSETLPVPAIIVIAAAIGVAVAVLVGLATLRLRGVFFVIFTFGLAELIRQIVVWYEVNVTRTVGRYIFLDIGQERIYWQLLALTVLVLFTGWLIRRSRLGLALRVIGDDETVARHVAINTTAAKLILFAVSAAFMSVTGAVMAPRWTYIDPAIAFNPLISFQVVIMALLGGADKLWGPLLGVVPLVLLFEVINANFPNHFSIVVGLVFIVIVYFLPGGVAGLADRWRAGAIRLPVARARAAAFPGTPMLEVRNLRKAFGGLVAVDDVSFTVGASEIVGLIGPNGSGKTTVLNLISGALKPDSGGIVFKGQSIAGLPANRIARLGIARTFQIVRVLDNLSALDNVIAGLAFRPDPLWGDAARERARELLDRVGLSARGDVPAADLTYIDQKRLELARALALDPELLLLDEWLAGLNPSELAIGIALVRSLREEGLTIVMVEHVMDAIRSLCDRCVVMNAGRKIADGPPAAALNEPEVVIAYLGAADAWLARVGAAYGKHTALAGVDLVVGEKEIVVILGANGAGKSTLLKAIAGIVPRVKGSAISLGGRTLAELPPHEIVEAGIALVPEGRGVFAELTVAENLMLGAHPRRARSEEKKNHAAVLALFPRLRERMGQAVRTMSGGEQQMVAIGRALMSAPEVLLLDEPSLGLSPLLTHELFDALVAIRRAGVSVLLVEQNARESLRIADRGYLLETGRIVGEGRADRLAADPAVREAYLGVSGHATLAPADAIEIEALAGPMDTSAFIDATPNLPLEGRSKSAKPTSGGGTHPSDEATPSRDRYAISTSPQGGGWAARSQPITIPAAPSSRGRVSEDRPMFHTRLIIADRDVAAGDSRTFDRLDPVTGEVATRAAAASIGDAQKAADAAAAAFPEWSRLAPTERRKLLLKAADILQSKVDDFAAAVIAETGSPGHWAHFNVGLASDMIREAASMTTQVTGEVIPANRPGSLAMATRQPAGVILSIAPWNAPIILGVRAVAMPLACGNTVVFKASENCPRTHALIVESFREAGLPKGAINLVTNAPPDAAKIVEALIAHPKVKRINFTGSTRVGRIIAETAARYLKPVLLELGGKAPLIVLDDADIDEAVNAAVFGSFANAGQICMSTEKIVLDNAVADAFLAKFAARAAALPAGDPRGHVVLGACISADAVRRVADLIRDAVAKGAVVLAGGPADGPVMQATVVDRVTPAMRIFDEESFGPVVSVVRVDGEEEAIRVANDSEYGLSAAVFTKDIARGLTVARRIESGICHINGPTVHDEAQMPFGGTKASGYGRFGGKAAIDEFTERFRWITIQTEPMHYPF